MASIGWLHLTDLHLGLSGQRWLWPSVKEQFFKDLERLHAKSGPWDLVLFTGDLTQRGTKEEFDRLTETLGKLWVHLAKLGSKPVLVTVPGNHDLQRPKLSPIVRALRNWHTDADLREEFWAGADNEYRTVVSEAFAAYEGFVSAHPLPASFTVRQGTLSGDRSISLERDGLKLALVGLNSAFLQLEGGDYQGRLDLDVRQLHGVCGDDPPEWLGAHHVALLLTHHPTAWLHPRVLAGFKADLAPPGRFLAHLFGHMHEGTTTSLSVSGSSPQRAVQGPSLFGLETWGDGTEQRIHGYMAGRITLDNAQGTFTLWPRELRKNRAGAWQMTPDVSFDLHSEAAVEEFKARKETAAASSAVGATLAALTVPTAGMTVAVSAATSPAATTSAEPHLEIAKLSGPQLAEFQRTLLSAFPDTASIVEMTRFHLGENLAAIATGNLRTVVFELLVWAQSRGRLGDLLLAAVRYNPGNPDLRRLAASHGVMLAAPASAFGDTVVAPLAVPLPPTVLEAPAPTNDAAAVRELRATLASLYPSQIEAARLSDDARLNRARIDLNGSAQTVWFNVLDEARKSNRLGALVEVALAEYPQHPDLRRLARALAPTPTSAPAAEAVGEGANSYAVYDALSRLLTAQFEEVLFRLSVPTRHLPSPTSSQSERAIALVRLFEAQRRLPELATAIEKVGGRVS
jgi:predicted MPP superfamily phosphohydrolase